MPRRPSIVCRSLATLVAVTLAWVNPTRLEAQAFAAGPCLVEAKTDATMIFTAPERGVEVSVPCRAREGASWPDFDRSGVPLSAYGRHAIAATSPYTAEVRSRRPRMVGVVELRL